MGHLAKGYGAVEDRWQGRGLGLALTGALISAALRRRVGIFTRRVLPENAWLLGEGDG